MDKGWLWLASVIEIGSIVDVAVGIARPSVLSRAFVDDAGSYLDYVLLRCAPQLFTGTTFTSPVRLILIASPC